MRLTKLLVSEYSSYAFNIFKVKLLSCYTIGSNKTNFIDPVFCGLCLTAFNEINNASAF